MSSTESALVVLVPEAEAAIEPFRRLYDPVAAQGMPAHITLLYPFIPPDDISGSTLEELQDCVSHFTPFHFTLAKVRRFPGVLYLAPEPDEIFRDLTLEIWASFPERPPYGGRHPDIVPHLCIAQLQDEKALDRVAAAFAEATENSLSIEASVSDVAMMDNCSGRWQVRSSLPLGTSD